MRRWVEGLNLASMGRRKYLEVRSALRRQHHRARHHGFLLHFLLNFLPCFTLQYLQCCWVDKGLKWDWGTLFIFLGLPFLDAEWSHFSVLIFSYLQKWLLDSGLLWNVRRSSGKISHINLQNFNQFIYKRWAVKILSFWYFILLLLLKV